MSEPSTATVDWPFITMPWLGLATCHRTRLVIAAATTIETGSMPPEATTDYETTCQNLQILPAPGGYALWSVCGPGGSPTWTLILPTVEPTRTAVADWRNKIPHQLPSPGDDGIWGVRANVPIPAVVNPDAADLIPHHRRPTS